MRKILTAVILLAGLGVVYWGANELYRKKTRNGLTAKFTSPTYASAPEWDLPSASDEEKALVEAALRQKYIYLERGSQAFAFVSEDGKYVLKLFKQHKWRPSSLLGYLPVPFNPFYQKYLKALAKKQGVMSSCKAALLHVKEDTGVLYAHLNPAPLGLPPVKLTDKKGEEWELDLGRSCFLLQKKAELFYPYIQALMEKGNVEDAKRAISSTMDLLDRFFRKGVYDNNVILYKNFGFIDGEAMQFDIGKFKFDSAREYDRRDLRILVRDFRVWLKRRYPVLLQHLDAKLDELSPLTPS